MSVMKRLPVDSAVSIADQPRSVTGREPFSGPLAATLGDPDAGRVLGVPSDAWPYGGATPPQGGLGAPAHPAMVRAGLAGLGGCAPPEGWPVYGSITVASASSYVSGDGRRVE